MLKISLNYWWWISKLRVILSWSAVQQSKSGTKVARHKFPPTVSTTKRSLTQLTRNGKPGASSKQQYCAARYTHICLYIYNFKLSPISSPLLKMMPWPICFSWHLHSKWPPITKVIIKVHNYLCTYKQKDLTKWTCFITRLGQEKEYYRSPAVQTKKNVVLKHGYTVWLWMFISYMMMRYTAFKKWSWPK